METLEFGFYPREADSQIAPLRWMVIDSFDDNKIGIVSEEIIDVGIYDKNSNNWELSALRYWLNTQFREMAFSKEEQECICGDIFVMSFDEVLWYFSNANSRSAKATPYAKKKKLSLDKQGRGRYWLESPGYVPTAAAYTDTDGYAYETGMHVNSNEGIRPAMIVRMGGNEE